MVSGRMTEGRIGIGPSPGQNRRTINDQITRPRQPDPQARPHQTSRAGKSQEGRRLNAGFSLV